MAAETITVTLKKGVIGCTQKQRATVKGLGLTRRGKTRTLKNSPEVRGMIKKVIHLLEISES